MSDQEHRPSNSCDVALLRARAEGLRHNANVFRDLNQRARERQLLTSAGALCDAADEIERLQSDAEGLRDMLTDARLELAQLREALGVDYEPHQNLFERMIDAANHKRVDRAAHEPATTEPSAINAEGLLRDLCECYFFRQNEGMLEIMRRVDRFLVGDEQDEKVQHSLTKEGAL